MSELTQTEAAAVAEIAREAIDPQMLGFQSPKDGDLPILALIRHKNLVSEIFDARDYLPRPTRVKGDRALYTLDDFLAYVRTHELPASDSNGEQPWNPHILLRRDELLARCIFDHREGDLAAHEEATASHRLVFSKEIEPWRQKAERWMSQLEFAEWIEDHELEFVKPSSAEMLGLAQKFEASTSARFSSKHNLATGEIDLSYKLENNEQGTVKVPDEFTIVLPIFKGGERYQLPMRLRHRCRDGAVTFLFKFKSLDTAVDLVWADLVKKVREADLCPTFEVA